jgi:hypothetical protein
MYTRAAHRSALPKNSSRVLIFIMKNAMTSGINWQATGRLLRTLGQVDEELEEWSG